MRQPRRAGVRPRGRSHRRPPAHRLPRRRRRAPRPCSSTSTWRSTATCTSPSRPSVGSSTNRRSTPYRPASCCRPTSPTPTPCSTRSCAWVAERHRGRRRRRQGPPRQGRQPGHGARRRRARRLDRGAVRHQGRRRRQLQGAAGPTARRRRPPAGCIVGVGSHNLFDVAWALDERERRGLVDVVGIEMLEGMAPPQSRAVRVDAGAVLLYTPVVTDEDFAASIAYLSRRLDENAGPENFLRSLFTITPGSPVWEAERRRFEAAVAARSTISETPRAVPGPTPRGASLRPGGAVRQRARHRLHPGRATARGSPPTCATTGRRRSPTSSPPRPASTPSSSGRAAVPPSGGRRRRTIAAGRWPGWPRSWPPSGAGRWP